ncbi:glycosyltransferase [Alkalibacter mobilis]|uniref:glycosyltransferase n=1 Tax=Alkalibacter mobilis TaxID=2787712 RepID=UPI0018A067B6|nr:glycosyltransferase [Alkalibacter mobilis]
MDNDKKKKILIVNNNLDLGGVQRSLINLLKAVESDYDITLFLFSNTGEYKDRIPKKIKVIEAKAPLNLLGISQQESKSKGLTMYLLRALLSVYAKVFNNHLPIGFLVSTHPSLKSYDFAVSFLHNMEGHMLYGGCNDFVLRRVKAKNKVTFLHCDFSRCGANTKYTRKMMNSFNKIAAVSEGCKESFLEAMPSLKNRTKCVYNCHDFEEYRTKSEESPFIYDENYVNVLTVARLDAGKGILRGIKVFEKLLQEGFKTKWHIVGDGVLWKTVKDLISELKLDDSIALYGNQSNPYKYMKNADLLLLPSFHEAAPMVFMEAKSVGLPVLTTETISAREMIADGKEGYVCENSEMGIYEKIMFVLSNPLEIEKCKRYLKEQKYSNDMAVEQFHKLLN